MFRTVPGSVSPEAHQQAPFPGLAPGRGPGFPIPGEVLFAFSLALPLRAICLVRPYQGLLTLRAVGSQGLSGPRGHKKPSTTLRWRFMGGSRCLLCYNQFFIKKAPPPLTHIYTYKRGYNLSRFHKQHHFLVPNAVRFRANHSIMIG